MTAPLISQRLRFMQVSKQLAIQKRIPQPAVEALTASILPGADRLNVYGNIPRTAQLLAQSLGDKLWAIVTADTPRTYPLQHDVR